jgi:hypothetical protein
VGVHGRPVFKNINVFVVGTLLHTHERAEIDVGVVLDVAGRIDLLLGVDEILR